MTATGHLEQPQAIRAVLFDVGYTLLKPYPSVIDIVLQACAAQGLHLTREVLEQRVPVAERVFSGIVRDNPTTWSTEAAINAIWRAYYTALLRPVLARLGNGAAAEIVAAVQRSWDQAESYVLYPDAVPVLRVLHARGMTLGVVSDWGMSLALILRHHDLVRYLDFAVGSAAVRHAKPDPALFTAALLRADTVGDFAVHIGDSYVLDVLGARAAGITPILLDRAGRADRVPLDCLVTRDLYGLLDLLAIPRPAPQRAEALPTAAPVAE